jgi:hypothetical protein
VCSYIRWRHHVKRLSKIIKVLETIDTTRTSCWNGLSNPPPGPSSLNVWILDGVAHVTLSEEFMGSTIWFVGSDKLDCTTVTHHIKFHTCVSSGKLVTYSLIIDPSIAHEEILILCKVHTT